MLQLSFHQTKAEIMVRVASSLIFKSLVEQGEKIVKLSEISEKPQYGFTASAEQQDVGPKLVRITDLKDGSINWDSVPYCKCAEPDKYWLQPNDILFARTGATTGKTHLVQDVPDAIYASYLIRLRPSKDILPAYLYSFFQSDLYWGQIIEEKEGSAQPNVNGKKLISIQVPIVESKTQDAISNFLSVVRERQYDESICFPELPPPMTEQRRIMARIEELAAKVEEARELRSHTTKASTALSKTLITRALRDVPIDGLLGNMLIGKPRNGWSARCDNASDGIPVLALGAVTGFQYRKNEFKRTAEPTEEDAHYWLNNGDLLITRSNTPELVGHAAIYNGEPSPCIYPDLMMRLILDEEKVDKRFVHYWLQSVPVRDYISSMAKGTSPTMKKISRVFRFLCKPFSYRGESALEIG